MPASIRARRSLDSSAAPRRSLATTQAARFDSAWARVGDGDDIGAAQVVEVDSRHAHDVATGGRADSMRGVQGNVGFAMILRGQAVGHRAIGLPLGQRHGSHVAVTPVQATDEVIAGMVDGAPQAPGVLRDEFERECGADLHGRSSGREDRTTSHPAV